MTSHVALKRRAIPYAFVAPVCVLLALVNFYPLLYSLRLSLSLWPVERLREEPTFAGLVNFQAMLDNDAVAGAARFMTFYVLTSLAIEFVLGIGIAMLLDQRMAGRALVRALVILPIALAPLVAGLIWTYMLNSDYGIANYVLAQVGLRPISWLSSLPWAQISIVLADVWQNTPFVAIVVLAGLQAIPEHYQEAARIDGASAWQVFWRITLPLLRPAILVAGVVRATNAIRMFDLSYSITSGGPFRSTETFSFLAFQEAFSQFHLPDAAALSWLIFALNLGVSLLFIRVLYARVDV